MDEFDEGLNAWLFLHERVRVIGAQTFGRGVARKGETVKVRVTLTAGLPKDRVRAKLHYHNRALDVHRRALAFYLCDVDDRKLYEAFSAPTAAVFADRELGIGEKTARDLIRIERKLKGLRRLARAFDKGKISWSKVREITRVATPEHEKAWIRFAVQHSCAEVERKVAETPEGKPPSRESRGPRPVSMELRQRLPAEIYAVVDAALAKAMDSLGAGAAPADAWKVVGEHFLATFSGDQTEKNGKRKASAPYQVVFHVDKDGREAWLWGPNGRVTVPLRAALGAIATDNVIVARDIEDPGDTYTIRFGERGSVSPEERDPAVTESMRAIVLARDGHRCQLCGCTENLNVHHLEARANGGRTEVQFLLTICRRCHSLGHDGLLVLRFSEEGGLSVLDPEGKPVVKTGGAAEALEEAATKVPEDYMTEECPLTEIEEESVDPPEDEELPEREEPAAASASKAERKQDEPPRSPLDGLPPSITMEQWRQLEPCLEWKTRARRYVPRPGATFPDFSKWVEEYNAKQARKRAPRGAFRGVEAIHGNELGQENEEKRGLVQMSPKERYTVAGAP